MKDTKSKLKYVQIFINQKLALPSVFNESFICPTQLFKCNIIKQV